MAIAPQVSHMPFITLVVNENERKELQFLREEVRKLKSMVGVSSHSYVTIIRMMTMLARGRKIPTKIQRRKKRSLLSSHHLRSS